MSQAALSQSVSSILTLDRLTKVFNDVKAVDELSLEIREGEIFTLLGPSGCGKTTTLRQIAGLEHPSGGEIRLRDSLLDSPAKKITIPAHKRNMGMVFQSYAIWPHLTVFETVAYPLRARKTPKHEIKSRVMEILELVGLKGMEDRQGPALSGGQQQRVALARALVAEPDILLLDEPFSNLDVKLREQMRVEMKLLQRRIGVTIILVTHDQLEALSLSDRIAVMNKGRLEQVGTPEELYIQPKSSFVRSFIGSNVTLPGTLVGIEPNGDAKVRIQDTETVMVGRNVDLQDGGLDQDVRVSIRPEDIKLVSEGDAAPENLVRGTVDTSLFLGDRYEFRVHIGDIAFLMYTPRSLRIKEGSPILLHFPREVLGIWRN